jgi:hypothetical protein
MLGHVSDPMGSAVVPRGAGAAVVHNKVLSVGCEVPVRCHISPAHEHDN